MLFSLWGAGRRKGTQNARAGVKKKLLLFNLPAKRTKVCDFFLKFTWEQFDVACHYISNHPF